MILYTAQNYNWHKVQNYRYIKRGKYLFKLVFMYFLNYYFESPVMIC